MTKGVRIPNEEDGVEARIFMTPEERFQVVLHDTDADRSLPTVREFDGYADAFAYAQYIAGFPKRQVEADIMNGVGR